MFQMHRVGLCRRYLAQCWRVKDADHADFDINCPTVTFVFMVECPRFLVQHLSCAKRAVHHRSTLFVSKTYPKQGEVVCVFSLPPLLMFRQMIEALLKCVTDQARPNKVA